MYYPIVGKHSAESRRLRDALIDLRETELVLTSMQGTLQQQTVAKGKEKARVSKAEIRRKSNNLSTDIDEAREKIADVLEQIADLHKDWRFGVPLVQFAAHTDVSVPPIVSSCVDAIERLGAYMGERLCHKHIRMR